MLVIGARALRVRQDGGETFAAVETQTVGPPDEGELLLRAGWSSVNYKDALAVTGRGRILRRFPLTPGIDVAGTVAASRDPRFAEGAEVLATGYGLGVERDGGLTEWVRVPADWAVPLPPALSLRDAMVLGTAGFTAGLALARMERLGFSPEGGPVLVTGATGGVGSLAVALLGARGYEVTAATRKAEAVEYLRSLGASAVVDPAALAAPGGGPLASGRWGGVIDNVGGALLAEVLRAVRPWGVVASVGLAGGHALQTTVLPFVLRGVSLLGIDSVDCPMPLRREVWARLAAELAPERLARVATTEIGLEEVPAAGERLLAGEVVGRTLVRLGP